VIFDETAPCSHDVFDCAGDKKIEENIFVDEELQGFGETTSIYVITRACFCLHT
jgi:hypothetical protein